LIEEVIGKRISSRVLLLFWMADLIIVQSSEK
jgi:hypothetical protein